MATATVPKLRKALKTKAPGLAEERALWERGLETVVGVDEVGRGSWAGPLTIGAAVVPKDRRVYKLRDSKALTEFEREALFDRVADWCEAWSIGHAPRGLRRTGPTPGLRDWCAMFGTSSPCGVPGN